MSYGERLKQAMDWRGDALGRKIERKEVAAAADCTVQNIGMILNNAKNTDQKLSTEANANVAILLKVDATWLSTGRGEVFTASFKNAPSELTASAIEIAALFDMIPSGDKIKRAKAFNAATEAILKVLQSGSAKD